MIITGGGACGGGGSGDVVHFAVPQLNHEPIHAIRLNVMCEERHAAFQSTHSKATDR